MNTHQPNKQTALDFLNLVVAGNIDEAYETSVDFTGKHHYQYFPCGFLALRDAMKENHKQFPNKQFTIKNVLADSDLVAIHSHVILKPKDPGIAVVHLFRFKNGKIFEMWDVGQALFAQSPNNDGPF